MYVINYENEGIHLLFQSKFKTTLLLIYPLCCGQNVGNVLFFCEG